MTYDLILKGGTVVDGTGKPGTVADVGVSEGRIVAIGAVDGPAARRIDVGGCVVAPGVIDIHTHYDAQVCWDGVLSSSAEHGTTTVVQGNCGIGVAPCRPEHREITLRDLVVLEGIPYEVMDAGIDWSFETFPQYLDALQARGCGVNLYAMAPLATLRRYRMGDAASERAATPAEREAIAGDLRAAVDAGAMGFSATLLARQVGHMGRPLACRLADHAELAAYGAVLREAGRGIIQVNVLNRPSYMTEEEYATLDLLVESSGRPVTYSGALHRDDDPGAIEAMLQRAEPLRRRGAVPQTTIRPLTIEFNLRSPLAFVDMPAFKKVVGLTPAEQMALYRDPDWRAEAKAQLGKGGGVFRGGWVDAIVVRATQPAVRLSLLKSIAEVAAERGVDPLDAMVDLALDDELGTAFLGALFNKNMQHLRGHIADPRVMLGLGDGGAHLDMLFEAGYPTYLLGHWVRQEGAMTLEQAVRRLTGEPAAFLGLADRGLIMPGLAADLMVFDPARVGSPQRAEQFRHDLPGGGSRLYAGAEGMHYVIVNGAVLLEDGRHTGALTGRIVGGG